MTQTSSPAAKRVLRKLDSALRAAAESCTTPELLAAFEALGADPPVTPYDLTMRLALREVLTSVGAARADWPAQAPAAQSAQVNALQALDHTMSASAWVPNVTKSRPVEPENLVDAVLRDGTVVEQVFAKNLEWGHDILESGEPDPGDIMQWRLATRPQSNPPGSVWTTWQGGACPVPPETVVRLRLRNGRVTAAQAAKTWRWGWENPQNPNDAVQWRLASDD